jgi:hypothetical protein
MKPSQPGSKEEILDDGACRIWVLSYHDWIFAPAERGGQERRPRASQPGESI